MTPGVAGTLQNSQCSVNVGSSSVSGSGNNLTTNLAITFTSSFAGMQTTFMKADDNGGLTSGWQSMGSWSVPTAVNQPPSVVSVTPASGSGSGPQTFSFAYSDTNGFAYLNTAYALFSPTGSGTNACYLRYIRSANSLYLLNDDGTIWLGPMTPGVAGTLQNSQCSVNVGSSSVSGSGNNLTTNLAITFTSSFAGMQTTFMKADDNGGLTSGWQSMGSWSVPTAVNQPPSVVSVTPASGSGSGPQTFSFAYSDTNGFAYLNTAYALFSPTGSGTNACYLRYIRSANSLSLLNDDGTIWLGPMTPGAAGTLQNSQCSVNVGSSSVSGSGNNLTTNLAITFTSSFAGTQTTFMKADDNGGLTSGWQVMGSWSVPTAVNQPPSVVSVTPASGSGSGPQTFSFVYSDTNGFAYLNTAYALFSPTGSGTNACYLRYIRSANSLSLLNDDGTIWLGPMTPGTAGTLQNSQCSVNLGSSSVSGSGNNLTANLAITFSSSFAGTQTTFMKADDNGGLTSGWQAMGSWSVPAGGNQPPIPTLSQHVSCSSTGGDTQASYTCRLPNATLSNNLIVFGVSYFSSGASAFVTDDAGNNYRLGVSQDDGNQVASIYYSTASNPGVRAVTISFTDPFPNYISAAVSEFYNVSVSPHDTTSHRIGSNTTTVSAGALTPSSNGDLIYQYAIEDSVGYVQSWIQGSSPWALLSADRLDSQVAQYQVQSTAASINPALLMSPAGNFNTVAIAFKADSFGTPPPAGMRIVHEQHNSWRTVGSGVGTLSSVTLQFPSTEGMLAGAWIGAPEYDLTGLTSGASWLSTGPAFSDGNQSGDIQFYYAPGAASSTTLTIDVDTNYSDQFSADQSNLVLYDVTGADPMSPYCGARSTASDDQTSDVTTDGTTITPCSAGGLIFLQMARATNTAIGITPGYSGFSHGYPDEPR